MLAGCAHPAAPACHPMVEAQLLFGLTDDMAFTRFLDTDVTPRFPAGLTVFDTAGRWRTPAGHLLQQRSKVVLIVAERGDETLGRLQAIRTAYRVAFRQDSVGLVVNPVCADF